MPAVAELADDPGVSGSETVTSATQQLGTEEVISKTAKAVDSKVGQNPVKTAKTTTMFILGDFSGTRARDCVSMMVMMICVIIAFAS